MPQFNTDDPLKSEVYHLKILRCFNFQALGPKFVFAMEPKVLKLDVSFLGIRPYIYFLKGIIKKPSKGITSPPSFFFIGVLVC